MTTTTPVLPTLASPKSWFQRFARRVVLSKLAGLQDGALRVRDAQGEARHGRHDAEDGLRATITVLDPSVYGDVLARGILGAGEAFARGAWTTDDLVSLVRILLRNRPLMAQLDGSVARLSRPFLRGLHALQRNSRRGSRRNIEAHYDLGNDFFALFLDETMTYSSGVFEHDGATLAEASVAKYERLCRKLGLRPDHHVLEIGCGWGGFAVHAAGRYGCRVTATTISEQQYSYACERVRVAGLQDRVRILKQDYRDLAGTYDRIVSIEMIEAVGHAYLDTFVRVCQQRLRPGGSMALQAITIDDRHYDRARKTVDFIKRYIFPGSFIPSVKAIHDAFVRSTDMRLVGLEDIGRHYPETLRLWRERFLAHADSIREQGLSETFLRLWEYYFAYCEAGFRERFLSTVQLILTRPT